MRKKLAIEIRDLPPRARQLNPDELEGVFGGCVSAGSACFADADCCYDSEKSKHLCCTRSPVEASASGTYFFGRCNDSLWY